MPNPNHKEINSPEFEAIWNVIKNWDINAPDYYDGYCGGNGSHVKLILDALKPVIRQEKINDLLDEC